MIIYKFIGGQVFQKFVIVDYLSDVVIVFSGNFFYQWIGFRVNSGLIQWVFVIYYVQEVCGLFECFVIQVGYLFQVILVVEGIILIVEVDNIIGNGFVEVGNVCQ